MARHGEHPARDIASSIVHRYLTLVRYQRYVSERIRSRVNISGRQAAVLRYLMQAGPRTVGQISEFLYVRDATTSALIDRLERASYVTRHRLAEDNRKVLVELTDLGRETVVLVPLGTVALMRERLPLLSAEHLAAMDAALAKLCEIAQVDESVLE